MMCRENLRPVSPPEDARFWGTVFLSVVRGGWSHDGTLHPDTAVCPGLSKVEAFKVPLDWTPGNTPSQDFLSSAVQMKRALSPADQVRCSTCRRTALSRLNALQEGKPMFSHVLLAAREDFLFTLLVTHWVQ